MKKISPLQMVRNWINEHSYAPASKLHRFLKPLIFSVFFLALVLYIHRMAATLLLQFVVGAIVLHLFGSLLNRLWPSQPVQVEKLKSALQKENSPFRQKEMTAVESLLMTNAFDLQAERGKDFPLQQNALLILVLIWLGPQPDLSPLDYLTIAGSFFILKVFERSKNASDEWHAASIALRSLNEENTSST